MESIEQNEPKKRGPKPKADLSQQLEEANHRIDRLEQLLTKVCHFTGLNRLLTEKGLVAWEPNKTDMTKFKRKAG